MVVLCSMNFKLKCSSLCDIKQENTIDTVQSLLMARKKPFTFQLKRELLEANLLAKERQCLYIPLTYKNLHGLKIPIEQCDSQCCAELKDIPVIYDYYFDSLRARNGIS